MDKRVIIFFAASPRNQGDLARNPEYMAKIALDHPDWKFVQTVSAQILWSCDLMIFDKENAEAVWESSAAK